MIKRLPRKRGFTNIFRIEYSVVNLTRLNVFEPESEVDPEKLVTAGIVKSLRRPVKVLGEGDIDRPLSVKAHKFSAAARAKIEAAGGTAEEVANAGAAK